MGHIERKMDRPTMESLKARMRELGEKVSVASWEDARDVFVFSVRSLGPATYGHPAVTLHWNVSGWYTESGFSYRS